MYSLQSREMKLLKTMQDSILKSTMRCRYVRGCLQEWMIPEHNSQSNVQVLAHCLTPSREETFVTKMVPLMCQCSCNVCSEREAHKQIATNHSDWAFSEPWSPEIREIERHVGSAHDLQTA